MTTKSILVVILSAILAGTIRLALYIENIDTKETAIVLSVLTFIALGLVMKDIFMNKDEKSKVKGNKNEEEKETIVKNRFSEMLKFGQGHYPEISLNLDDILFIIDNKKDKELKKEEVRRLLAWGLGNVNLKDVLVTWVSNEKNQIVFHPKSAEILRLYEEAYDKIYDDKVLEALSGSIENLSRFLKRKTTVGAKGAKELRGLITKECKSFPFTSLNPGSIN